MSNNAVVFFFFNNPPPTEISPLPLPDPLRIYPAVKAGVPGATDVSSTPRRFSMKPRAFTVSQPVLSQVASGAWKSTRSEEHTSELQSRQYLVCRLLLEKKKQFRPSLLPSSTYL